MLVAVMLFLIGCGSPKADFSHIPEGLPTPNELPETRESIAGQAVGTGGFDHSFEFYIYFWTQYANSILTYRPDLGWVNTRGFITSGQIFPFSDGTFTPRNLRFNLSSGTPNYNLGFQWSSRCAEYTIELNQTNQFIIFPNSSVNTSGGFGQSLRFTGISEAFTLDRGQSRILSSGDRITYKSGYVFPPQRGYFGGSVWLQLQCNEAAATCGNGQVERGEQCDDRNTQSNDGCSSLCQLERGWTCSTPGQACIQICGNGQIDPGEQCDGINLNGITCLTVGSTSVTAQRFTGGNISCYSTGTPTPCTFDTTLCTIAVCGNGQVEGNGQCDLGSLNGQPCRTASGQNCNSCSSSCTVVQGSYCGDGIVDGSELCDDGNTASGDGCSATCTTEAVAVGCQPGYNGYCGTVCSGGVCAPGRNLICLHSKNSAINQTVTCPGQCNNATNSCS